MQNSLEYLDLIGQSQDAIFEAADTLMTVQTNYGQISAEFVQRQRDMVKAFQAKQYVLKKDQNIGRMFKSLQTMVQRVGDYSVAPVMRAEADDEEGRQPGRPFHTAYFKADYTPGIPQFPRTMNRRNQ